LKKLLFFLSVLTFFYWGKAQNTGCTFKEPSFRIHFGSGNVSELNTTQLYNYSRVRYYCPSDGYYAYTPYTSDCFRGDWHTLTEDHTPGDEDGNMMLVNASAWTGDFLSTGVSGLKAGASYEFAVWMMNVCKISEKCPYPLLPNITILLQTPEDKIVMQCSTGELQRVAEPQWKQYRAMFTMPANPTALTLTMIDNSPGGCGNDFALDDVTFRECVKLQPLVTTKVKSPAIVKQKPPVSKPSPKKVIPQTDKRQVQIKEVVKPRKDSLTPVVKLQPPTLPPPPPVVATRANPLIKKIETVAGEMILDLYDNGEIDGDTISVYHNNALLVSHAKLSGKPISFKITVDAAHPHHELIMVAHNLGSIPPNTSLMVVTAGSKRYEVFISSNEQKNAKIILELKE
jgi:hypothetical protein